MRYLALFTLLLFAYPLHAQDIQTILQDSAYSTGYCVSPENGGAVDSQFVTLQSGGDYFWVLPRKVYESEVDSVGVWLAIQDSAKVEVLSAYDYYNRFVLGSIQGPCDYGYYQFAFRTEHIYDRTARFIAVSATAPKFKVGFAMLDAACMLTKQPLSVKEEPKPTKRPSSFIDLLGRPCKPTSVYKLLPDGRALAW